VRLIARGVPTVAWPSAIPEAGAAQNSSISWVVDSLPEPVLLPRFVVIPEA